MRCSKHDCNQYALASSAGGGLCRLATALELQTQGEDFAQPKANR